MTDDLGRPDERTPAQRRATSYHEAAHGLAGRVLGLPVDHISIRIGEHFSGIANIGWGPQPEWNGLTGALLMNWGWRNYIERQIVVDLAGHFGSMASRYPYDEFKDTDDTWARRAAAVLEEVSPRTRELILAEEASPETDDDETSARKLAEKWSTLLDPLPSHLFHYIEWLRGEAHDLIVDHFDQLVAIADQLYKRFVLTGPQIDEIRRGLRCSCHYWPKETPLKP